MRLVTYGVFYSETGGDKMKTNGKRIIAVLLSFVMVLVFMPSMAFAAATSDDFGEVPKGDVESFNVGEAKDATLSSKKDMVTYKFIPEQSGHYIFQSKGDLDTYGIAFFKTKNEWSYASGGNGGGS